MTDNLRIHIIPVGYDTTRATETVAEQKGRQGVFHTS